MTFIGTLLLFIGGILGAFGAARPGITSGRHDKLKKHPADMQAAIELHDKLTLGGWGGVVIGGLLMFLDVLISSPVFA